MTYLYIITAAAVLLGITLAIRHAEPEIEPFLPKQHKVATPPEHEPEPEHDKWIQLQTKYAKLLVERWNGT